MYCIHTCVTPPGPHHHTERVSNPGCRRSTKETKGYSASFRGVRFTHSPYWHTPVTHACTVCSFNRLFWSLNWRQTRVQFLVRLFMMTRSGHARSVTADRTGKFVLLTYSLTASHCSTEVHLARVPFPRSFDSRLALRRRCSARLKSLPFDVDAKKHTGSAS